MGYRTIFCKLTRRLAPGITLFSFRISAFWHYPRRTAMHLAASEGKMDVLQYLVGINANIMCRDRFNGCPLEDAVRHHFEVRNADAVQKLLREHGATLAGEGLDYVSRHTRVAGHRPQISTFSNRPCFLLPAACMISNEINGSCLIRLSRCAITQRKVTWRGSGCLQSTE